MTRNYTPEEISQLLGRDGDTLADALTTMGWDPERATSTRLDPGCMHAFIELHIEQGVVLETEGTDIGVVTSIVGLGGGVVEFTGRQDHAGTTPLTMRRDALQGAAAFITDLPAVAAAVSPEAVATVGIVTASPGAGNVVPGHVRLQIDFRDPDKERMQQLEKKIAHAAEQAASSHGLEVVYIPESFTDPIPLDEALQGLIRSSAEQQGLTTRAIPSGAGHDSQNMAKLTRTGMIFVPSIDGRSHSPAEDSHWDDIEAGANVLLGTITALASE